MDFYYVSDCVLTEKTMKYFKIMNCYKRNYICDIQHYLYRHKGYLYLQE